MLEFIEMAINNLMDSPYMEINIARVVFIGLVIVGLPIILFIARKSGVRLNGIPDDEE